MTSDQLRAAENARELRKELVEAKASEASPAYLERLRRWLEIADHHARRSYDC